MIERAGGLGVVDGLDGLRYHHPVVGGHHHAGHDVGDIGALARACGREGRVAGGVEEGDALAVGQTHLIGADVLGDPAVFAGGHIGGAQGVEQAGLAVVDVTHHRHHRRAGQQVVVDILGGQEAFFHVRFRHAANGVTEFGGHQFGGVGIDHVVDLQHQALTHQELDDLHPAGGHAVGQFLHGDDVGNDHFASRLGLLLRAALAFFAFAFTGPAHRGQGAHAFHGLVVVAGHGLDGQAAFAALRGALDAADRLAGSGASVAHGGGAILIVVRRAVDDHAGTRRLAGGALDFRRGGRRGFSAAHVGGAGTAGAGAVAAGRRSRRQG